MSHIATGISPVSMLECMMLIRAYEEKLAALHAAEGVAGTCTSVGQEASAVGVVRALGAADRILTAAPTHVGVSTPTASSPTTAAPATCSPAGPMPGA